MGSNARARVDKAQCWRALSRHRKAPRGYRRRTCPRKARKRAPSSASSCARSAASFGEEACSWIHSCSISETTWLCGSAMADTPGWQRKGPFDLELAERGGAECRPGVAPARGVVASASILDGCRRVHQPCRHAQASRVHVFIAAGYFKISALYFSSGVMSNPWK